jgi:drug/metabolite transporter (DMT)-like permease
VSASARERRAAGLIVLAACGFGTLSVVVALSARGGVALTALMAWRYALAAPILALAAGGLRHLRIDPRRALALLVLGGGGQTAVTWLSLSSLEWLSAATLGFLFYTYPAWVAVFAALARTERLTPIRIGALALALGGITLMVGSPWSAPMPLPGLLRALGSAVVYALYIPLLHRMRGPLSASVASTYVILGAGLVFLAISLRNGTLFAGMTPGMWGLALVLAVFSTAVAFITFLRGLEVLGPVRTAILSTVEPFWTALLAALVLAQPVGIATIGGGALIVVAILLLQRSAHPVIPDAPPPD